jgi:hypothetical protein
VKAQGLLQADWDHLVVLDACRYDAFVEVYDDYLDGDVEKRRSSGSATPEWASKTFTGTHDLRYFSANPFINSLGVPLNETGWGASCDYEWAASDHLAEVVDLWREGWDDELGTVPPAAVNRAVREAGTSARRTVVHYMQPHAPFLSRGRGRKLERIRDGVAITSERDGPVAAAGARAREWLERLLGENRLVGRIGLWADLSPDSLLEAWTEGTAATLRRYHEENLRLAMESVADLVTRLDGRVVVTADHGEAFGEQGVWEHRIETHIPVLVEVPWLVVE